MVPDRIYKLLFGALALGLSLSPSARAEIMFEGYSIIRSGSLPIGYTIQRYEFDPKMKQFTATSFLKTNDIGNNITESLKAVANDKFQPISFQYVTKVGERAKMIDAKFVKDEMTATVTDGKKAQNVKVKMKKGIFLSTFLGYLMLQNGYRVDKKFTYSAIAEEDGVAYSGEAFIKAEEEFKGQKVFRIVNSFKGAQFISFVTAKGEVLGTTSPIPNISTELVADPAEATKGFLVPADTLKILFGSVPTGKINALASGSRPAPTLNEANTAGSALPAKEKSARSVPSGKPPTKARSEPNLPGEN